ncbi:hypothetical protein [Paenibacillus turpanensis]|uniref:hypothetical protein n=1 Tax=Paenibacillus turpanensis TaxID=2689078 RepID=UPI00140D26A6|nr:hypothetical protein [Paenibacillus turpanensis]
MDGLILLFGGVLLSLLVISFAIRKWLPGRKALLYAPSTLVLLAGGGMLGISFFKGGFEGLGMAIFGAAIGAAGLLALLVFAIWEYFSDSDDQKVR